MSGKLREACGRCGLSNVVEAVGDDEDDEPSGMNPFDGDCIEVDERELRAVSRHVIFLGDLKRRLNDAATRFIYR